MVRAGYNAEEPHSLLWDALADQLKVPLLQIARRAELSRTVGINPDALSRIEDTAQLALSLIDNYLLAVTVNQVNLQLEPVSLSAVLNDTAHSLMPVAKQYGCELELSLSGKYGPVMANQTSLQAALVSLGHAFIEASQDSQKKSVVVLAAHRGKQGTVAGIFSEIENLTSGVYRRAKILQGRARQPLNTFTASSGAGVFVADTLLSAMDIRLRVASHHKATGLAATFTPSRQLRLV